MSSSRAAIISRLRANHEVDDWADLCIYPSGSLFVVEFFPPSGPFDTAGLSDDQADQLRDEGELSEYYETPEEAADLYLLLEERCQGRLLPKKAAFSDDADAPRKPRPAKKGASLPALDAETFEQAITGSADPVVVLLWSPWSGPDRLALPAVTAVAANAPGVRFFTLDVDESPEVVTGLKVAQTPACLVFRAGSLHARIEGAITEDALRKALAR
ncbi:MAG: thioredoxin family protein [Gemmataceae bacterium]